MGLTPYGKPQILICTLVLGVVGVASLGLAFKLWLPFLTLTGVSFLVWGWVLYFFRDPKRAIPEGESVLVCPADGVVTHVDEVEEPDFLGGRAKRISIFMSVFSVHVNRAPLAGTVKYNQHHKGDFINAMNPDCSHINERNDLGLETGDSRLPKVLVRQVAGLIARRIVCDQPLDATLAKGEIFGMIKFGSRVEVFVPVETDLTVKVEIGQAVQAGSTVLGELGS